MTKTSEQMTAVAAGSTTPLIYKSQMLIILVLMAGSASKVSNQAYLRFGPDEKAFKSNGSGKSLINDGKVGSSKS